MTYADQLVNRLVAALSAERPPQAQAPQAGIFVTVGATDYQLLIAIADLANDLRHGLVQHFGVRDLPATISLTESELYPLLEDYEARRTALDVFDADARTVNDARQ